MAEEETEYESDPEEAKMSLKMRRREASDDEEERERELPHPRAGIVDSEGESDGQGGAADYIDEDEEEEDYYDEQEGRYEEEVADGEGEYEEREIGDGGGGEAEGGAGAGAGAGANVVEGTDEGHELMGQSENPNQGEGQEEKKENEPFAVPTSGAFYMHDDRFRDNAGGRNRRTFGGRKLWESKDERKWGHDKFEEMSMHDRNSEEGRRSSKGYYRGRGRGRGTDRGYARGNRMRGYGGNNNQNVASKDVKGRGPRRYQPSMKSKSETIPLQNKQSVKSIDRTSHAGLGRNAASTSNQNVEHEPVPARKVASSLSSASPPFYPSGSSSKDITLTQKKEVQAGNHNRNPRTSVVDQNFSMPLSNTSLRGKNVIDSTGMDKLHIDDSVSPASAKPLNNVQLPSSSSSSLSTNQMPQSRAQGRGVVLSGSTMLQPVQSNNQVNKVSPPAAQAPQRNPVQNRGQPSLQASGQQMGQRSIGASQGSSPPKAGKGTVQGDGRGSHVYGGAQGLGSGGNMGAGHGDQNLPAFFPVMQFGAQRPGGIGVPAVGMAFPGYVAQPNGLGNSEMTWLPVLASAAGALGATYCPPYLAVDGTYHPRPTAQTSALPAPSKDNTSKPNNEVKPRQRSEVSNDEFSQRQNKPRRYSEMNFSQ